MKFKEVLPHLVAGKRVRFGLMTALGIQTVETSDLRTADWEVVEGAPQPTHCTCLGPAGTPHDSGCQARPTDDLSVRLSCKFEREASNLRATVAKLEADLKSATTPLKDALDNVQMAQDRATISSLRAQIVRLEDDVRCNRELFYAAKARADKAERELAHAQRSCTHAATAHSKSPEEEKWWCLSCGKDLDRSAAAIAGKCQRCGTLPKEGRCCGDELRSRYDQQNETIIRLQAEARDWKHKASEASDEAAGYRRERDNADQVNAGLREQRDEAYEDRNRWERVASERLEGVERLERLEREWRIKDARVTELREANERQAAEIQRLTDAPRHNCNVRDAVDKAHACLLTAGHQGMHSNGLRVWKAAGEGPATVTLGMLHAYRTPAPCGKRYACVECPLPSGHVGACGTGKHICTMALCWPDCPGAEPGAVCGHRFDYAAMSFAYCQLEIGHHGQHACGDKRWANPCRNRWFDGHFHHECIYPMGHVGSHGDDHGPDTVRIDPRTAKAYVGESGTDAPEKPRCRFTWFDGKGRMRRCGHRGDHAAGETHGDADGNADVRCGHQSPNVQGRELRCTKTPDESHGSLHHADGHSWSVNPPEKPPAPRQLHGQKAIILAAIAIAERQGEDQVRVECSMVDWFRDDRSGDCTVIPRGLARSDGQVLLSPSREVAEGCVRLARSFG